MKPKSYPRVRSELLAHIRLRMKEDGTNESSVIRDILTELVHECRTHGLGAQERLAAAIQVADEEDAEDGLVCCVCCDKWLPAEESYSPGDDVVCPACDTDITGRNHKEEKK